MSTSIKPLGSSLLCPSLVRPRIYLGLRARSVAPRPKVFMKVEIIDA